VIPTGRNITVDSADDALRVIACGVGWLVVEKACGISIHNDPGRDVCSLALAMAQAGQLPMLHRGIRALHAAHRIDKDTSGIVLLAGDADTLAFFGRQFTAGTVDKQYLALVHGRIHGMTSDREWIEWTWPLAATAAGRSDPRGRGRRQPCTTRIRLISHSGRYSLIECSLLTGRKHQIRRHAKLAGHPVVGDRRYGSPRSLTYLHRHHNFSRLALHAHALAICLPGEESSTSFRSSGLPEEIQRLFDIDRQS